MGASCSSRMGGICSASRSTVKIEPDNFNPANLTTTKFVPPITYISPNNPWLKLLTPHQLVEIDCAFKKFDRDGDGHIHPKELRTVMMQVGMAPSEETIANLIKSVDTDG